MALLGDKKFGIDAGVIGGGTFGAEQFIDLASGLQTTWRRSLVNRGGQQGFGQLYNQVLSK